MRDDAWSESYVENHITSCGKLVGFIWTKLVPRTCPPEKSVHLETVAFRESRPVALPNPLHLAILSARLFPGSSILQAKVLAPVISSRASSVPTAIICCVSVGLDLEIMERLAHYQAVTQIQQLTSNFPRFNEMIV